MHQGIHKGNNGPGIVNRSIEFFVMCDCASYLIVSILEKKMKTNFIENIIEIQRSLK